MKLKFLLAASAFALMGSAGGASAYVACNREGDCWHTDERTRAPGVTFQIHPDDWYFHRHWDSDREHHWREYRDGRGYWRNGVWITL
jgi:hypothetical protein